MKTLIIYYSRTGLTKKLANSIREKLPDCDIEEIKTKTSRTGMIQYLLSGKEAVQEKITDIENTIYDPKNYDRIIIGTPIWAANISSPIRTYIEKNKNSFKKVFAFFTQGSSGAERAILKLQKALNQNISTSLILSSKEVAKSQYQNQLDEFISKLN